MEKNSQNILISLGMLVKLLLDLATGDKEERGRMVKEIMAKYFRNILVGILGDETLSQGQKEELVKLLQNIDGEQAGEKEAVSMFQNIERIVGKELFENKVAGEISALCIEIITLVNSVLPEDKKEPFRAWLRESFLE